MVRDASPSNIEELARRAKEASESKGLGDTVKKITDKLGIKQCGGCKKRQRKLNELFPYEKKDKT